MNPLQMHHIKIDLLEQTPFPSFVLDKNSHLIQWSSISEKYFGYSAQELVHTPLEETLFAALHTDVLHALIDTADTIRFNELQLLTKDGDMPAFSVIAKHVRYNEQPAIWVIAIPLATTRTIDQQHQELIDLRNGIQSSLMMVTLDNEGFITSCNPQFLKVSHWTPKRVLGKTFWRLFPETEEGTKMAQNIWRTLQDGQVWQGEVEKATKDGQTYWVFLMAIPTTGTNPNDTHFILIEKDITKEKAIQLQLEKIAYIDPETGLMNIHRLEHVVSELIEEGRHFSFVYLSIDKFYTLKDWHDDTSDSNLINEFTKRLKTYFQDSMMARINEHEFVTITPLPEWFIQGFQGYLQQHPIYKNHTAVPLSISGGITRYPEDQHSFTQLIKASIATIANVREVGGDQIMALSKSTHKALNRKALIEKRLLLALNRNNLKVLYQPQVDLTTGKMIGVEALVRWDDEEAGVVAPDELIPIAEETGLINRIGAYVLESACEQAVLWKNAGLHLKVSINSSVREFRDKNMAKSILNTLAKTNCPANLIQIEITEKFALEAEAETSIIKQMRQLENEGIVFILDDFGTGYASFRYMQLLPIEILKIDQTYTHSMLQSEKTQRLMDGIVKFGKSMNLTVLAEGVETEEQKDLLTTYGCDLIQGFYISKPTEAAGIELLYHARK